MATPRTYFPPVESEMEPYMGNKSPSSRLDALELALAMARSQLEEQRKVNNARFEASERALDEMARRLAISQKQ